MNRVPPFSSEPTHAKLFEPDVSSLRKYQDFFVGTPRLGTFLKFEAITMLLSPMPGALGYLLRKWFYPYLFKKLGTGVLWGKNITLRDAGRIEIGDRVAIDDDCLLDARGVKDEGVQIGSDVLIARGTTVQAKSSWVKIGDRCIVGTHCHLGSVGGIRLGNAVMIAGHCYIGGGRYRTSDRDIPMMDQGVYSEGPIIIEDDVWLGAGAIVLDGVRIGRGCVIGSGAVIRESVPEYTVVTPYQKLVMLPRSQS